jgi:hypothetical protein
MSISPSIPEKHTLSSKEVEDLTDATIAAKALAYCNSLPRSEGADSGNG